MGPCEAECPERILRLLTPTGHDYAREWRRRCRARLALRDRSLADGDRIHFAEPMRFTDGHVGQEFDVERIGRRIVLRAVEGRGRYRISRLMDRAWTIVPRTRVHATLFA